MGAFNLDTTIGGTTDKLLRMQLSQSLQFYKGGALKLLANGKLSPLTSQTDQATHIMYSPSVLTDASSLAYANVVKISREQFWNASLVALLSGVGIVTGSTATSLILPMAAGTTNDLIGATVYHRPSKSTRLVTANTYSTINSVPCVTLTIVESLGFNDPKNRISYPNTGDPLTPNVAVTPTIGDLCDLVPYGVGSKAVKFDSTFTTISNAVADLTGGTIEVDSVNFNLALTKVRLLAA